MESASGFRKNRSQSIDIGLYFALELTLNDKKCAKLGPETTMTFGERLRQLRIERKINQRDLAGQVGIDISNLS